MSSGYVVASCRLGVAKADSFRPGAAIGGPAKTALGLDAANRGSPSQLSYHIRQSGGSTTTIIGVIDIIVSFLHLEDHSW